jgi:hypothetical protein
MQEDADPWSGELKKKRRTTHAGGGLGGGEAIESCHERGTDVNVAREIMMLLTRDPAIDLAVIAMAVCEHRR